MKLFSWFVALLAMAALPAPAQAPQPAAIATASTAEIRQALAPSGKLRIAVYAGSPTSMVIDPASKEVRGVSVEVGKELAKRLGVPYELVEYQRVAEVIEGLKSRGADFTVSNATPERMQFLDFTRPVLAIELGYLVPAGSSIARIADVDRPGVRLGVSQGSTSFGTLSRELKNVAITQAPNLEAAAEMMAQHKIDAYATNKGILFQLSDRLPGSRVLDGRWGLEQFAIAIPKGRERGMDYVRKFVDDISNEGLVSRAAERAGLRGTTRVEAR